MAPGLDGRLIDLGYSSRLKMLLMIRRLAVLTVAIHPSLSAGPPLGDPDSEHLSPPRQIRPRPGIQHAARRSAASRGRRQEWHVRCTGAPLAAGEIGPSARAF